MWNDTELPLGYLITFRCYGTWLHGDKRGSIDRFHHRYESPYLPRSDRRRDLSERRLKSSPVTLDARQRLSVDNAIREVCSYRGWQFARHQCEDKSCACRGFHRHNQTRARTQCVQGICNAKPATRGNLERIP